MPLFHVKVTIQVTETTDYNQIIPVEADDEEQSRDKVQEKIDEGDIGRHGLMDLDDDWEAVANIEIEFGEVEITEVTEATGSEEADATE